MKKTGRPRVARNDQVAPEPPGDPDQSGREDILAKDCVGHHGRSGESDREFGRVFARRPPATDRRSGSGHFQPFRGLRTRTQAEAHARSTNSARSRAAGVPPDPALIRQRGEIGRAQNATIFIGPALPARPYCHGGDLPRMLAGSCSASVPPPEPTRILGGRGHRQCRVHQTVPERLRHTTDSRGNATLGGIPQASAGPVREIPPSASSGP